MTLALRFSMQHKWKIFVFLVSIFGSIPAWSQKVVEADLLIAGANEAGAAAAIQAARMGVKRIVLTNDIEWLGGQFSAEGVGCIDEWTGYQGKRVNFPRSGLFLEMMRRVREHNGRTYGVATPGNAFCGTDTIEPAAAAQLFEKWLGEYRDQIIILRPLRPVRVELDGNRVAGVEFENPTQPSDRCIVRAKLTLDCTDWGDVVRLSGAKYAFGPDLKSRFGEPSAPESVTEAERNEMNPISWCVIVRETGKNSIIPAPEDYDPRKYAALDTTPPFVGSAMAEGIYSSAGWSVYTHRRLVDRWHHGFPFGTEKVLLNWPVQDYPLYDFPQRAAEALEKTEIGASRKNIVEMSYDQRRIVFDDAKRHSLGLLHHLQTKVHDRVGDYPQSFRYMELSNEFGTADRLPPKPYVREGLRLEALYMLKEQDIRAADRNPRWAKVMPPDAIFGFQFNIDFHPTRRKFLDGKNTGPWQFIQTPTRNWHTDTDRAMFPLRGLVPVERDGLLGASKNIGFTSVVESALRLHGQMMLCGQTSAALAALCLKVGVQPRQLAKNWSKIRELQTVLARGTGGGFGVLLWPYQDLSPEEDHFLAANMLAVTGIWPGDDSSVDFRPFAGVSKRELARILCKARLGIKGDPYALPEKSPTTRYTDIAVDDPDAIYIHALAAVAPSEQTRTEFFPNRNVDWKALHQWMQALGLNPSPGMLKQGNEPLIRQELARFLWSSVKDRLHHMDDEAYLTADHDADADGLPDLSDPMPFDKDNDRIPDRLDNR